MRNRNGRRPGLRRGWRAQAVAVALAAAPILAGCEHERLPILLIGDSVTAATCGEDPCIPFAEIYAAADPRAINAGCGFTTSASWIQHRGQAPDGLQCERSRLPEGGLDAQLALVAPHVPAATAFVLLGLNDSRPVKDRRAIEPLQYRENQRTLVDELSLLGVSRIVLVKPGHTNRRDVLRNARIDAYALVIDELCGSDDRVLCGPDLRDVLRPEHFGSDPIHPNQAGHRAIASAYIDFARAHDL